MRCKYVLFDTLAIPSLPSWFVAALQDYVRDYRKDKRFSIKNFIDESKTYRPDSQAIYFVSYDAGHDIVSTARIYIYARRRYAYINLVNVNPKHRGQGVCKKHISRLLAKTKDRVNTYELEVDVDNIAAQKCYEANGFKVQKTIKLLGEDYYVMKKQR